MPLFSSRLDLTTAASSSGTALSNIEFTRGAFYSVAAISDLNAIPVARIAHDQIVWVESASATYQATLFVADFETRFEDSASWGVFNGFGGEAADVSGLNTFTGSIQTEVNSIKAVTGSYATTGSNTFTGKQIIQSGSGIEFFAEVSTADSWVSFNDQFIETSPRFNIQTSTGSYVGASRGVIGLGAYESASKMFLYADSMSLAPGQDHHSGSKHMQTKLLEVGNLQLTSREKFLTKHITGSTLTIEADVTYTGSNTFNGGMTGSLLGTASYALYAVSASHEIVTEVSSSHSVQADTASFISPGLGLAFENDSINLNTGSSHFTNAVQNLSDTSIFSLTGSDYATTNNIQITGSLSLQLDSSGDSLAIYSGSDKRVSITNEGILVLTTQSASPTAVKGGMYLDSNYDLYIGQD